MKPIKRWQTVGSSGASRAIDRYMGVIGLGLMLILGADPMQAPAQPVEPGFRRFFQQYVDEPGYWEKVLDRIGLTGNSVGRSFALVAGVSTYPWLDSGERRLDPAAEDLTRVVAFLKDEEVFDEIVLLQDAAANADNLRYFLSVYFTDRLAEFPKSRFFFVYSGHGFNKDEEGYLLTSTARSMTDRTNSVDMSVLRLWVDRAVGRAYQSLVLINACHSGAFLLRPYGEADDQPRLPSEPGAHVVTASGSDEKSWHDPRIGPGSIFFEKFLSGVQGGYADTYPKGGGDGVVTVDELITYLRQEVNVAHPDQSPLAADISRDGSKGGLFFLHRKRRVDPQVKQRLDPETTSFGEDETALVVQCDVACIAYIDGQDAVPLSAFEMRSIRVSPGEHLITIGATGFPEQQETVTLERGTRKVLDIKFRLPITLGGSLSNQGWTISFFLTEKATEFFWKLEGEDAFRSTGFSAHDDPQTGRPMPLPWIMLPYRGLGDTYQILVKYTDLRGQEVGPFKLSFDTRERAVKEVKSTLQMVPEWISYSLYDGRLLVYFSHLLSYKHVIEEIRYSVDDTSVSEVHPIDRPEGAEDPRAITSDDLVYIELPLSTEYICVQITFVDGTQSEVKQFTNPYKS